ncbi:MAG TPA: aspartate aminotransferase family protein [Vicinamibacterales bacterium]|nr:aspartate aminotransferase family protein [Vicinamibacterales bacterium]
MTSTRSSLPDAVVSDREHLLHPLHHPTAHQRARIWVEGHGAIIKDADGREYIDGLSGLWNVNVGHGRRELAEAASAQMSTLAYASSYAGSTNYRAIELAEKLSALTYPSINAFYFASGGAEATDTSIKTARFYWKATGKPEKVKVISRLRGYHGVTMAAMSATGLPAYWPMFEPRMPGFAHIDAPDPYRFVSPDPAQSIGVAAANQLEAAILRENADTVAAFIAEPVQGAGGVIIPPPDYFARIREICDRYDVLFISDEVITGFGRTGRWFGLEHYGVEPDILQFAKGITSGYVPLGGIGVSDRVRDVLNTVSPAQRWMHAYTYSGHPTCCAVALRNIRIIEDERLVERVRSIGARFQAALESLRSVDGVGDVRAQGLMGAVEVVADRTSKALHPAAAQVTQRLTDALLDRGLYTRVAMDCICLAPPFVVSEDEIDRIVAIIADAIPAVLSRHGSR